MATSAIATGVPARAAMARNGSDPFTLLLGAIAVAMLAASVLWYADIGVWTLRAVSMWSLTATASAYLFVTRRSQRGFWSASGVFMLVAMCFHQGLLLYSALGLTPAFEGATGFWFTSLSTTRPALSVTIALLSFGLAAGGLAQGSTTTPARVSRPNQARIFGCIGFVTLAGCVGVWFVYSAIALGPIFFLTSYGKYRESTGTQPLPYIFYGIGLGLVLVAASSAPAWRRRAAIVFVLFACAALPIGLRGEVLFPAAAAAAVYARSGSRLPRRLAVVLLVVGLLACISVLQQVRVAGLGNVTASDISATPLRGVAELGGSLRTVDAVHDWRAAGGPHSFQNGATYLAPFDRAVRGRILGTPVPPAASDMRLFNIEMRTRETTIGGSFVAEAYRNFGLLGVIAIPALIGLLLGAFDRSRRSIVLDAALGVFLFALLQHVRNSFAPAPAQVVIGLGLITLLVALSKTTNKVGLRT